MPSDQAHSVVPLSCEPQQRAAEEVTAQAVLDARAPHLAAGASVADLRDPLAMPAELWRACRTRNHAVDCADRSARSARAHGRVKFPVAHQEPLTASPAPAATSAMRRRLPQD